jgi:HEAT repeat protein
MQQAVKLRRRSKSPRRGSPGKEAIVRRLSLAACFAVLFAPVAAFADRDDDNLSPFEKKVNLATDATIAPVVQWRVAPGFEMFEVYPPAKGVELGHFAEDLIKELSSDRHTNRKLAVAYLSHLAIVVRSIAWEQDRDDSALAFHLALGKYRQRIQTALERVLKNGNQDERVPAAAAILSLSPDYAPAVDVIVKELQKDETSSRNKACELVGNAHLSHPKIMAALAASIDSTHAEVRRAAAKAAWQIGPKAAKCVPALIKLLKSGDDACDKVVPFAVIAFPTRMNLALLALSEMGTDARPGVPAIVQLLKTTEPIEVFDCLARLGPNAREELAELRQVLDAYKGYDRLMAAATILCIEPEDPKALDILFDGLRSTDKGTRNKALNACARFGPKIKALAMALTDSLKDDYSPPEAVGSSLTPLKAQGSSFDSAVRAIELMGSLAEPAIPTLTELAISGSRKPDGGYDFTISAYAAHALGGIGKASIPALKKVINTPDSEGADQALYSLGRMGKDGADAIPILIKALSHENALLRLNAAIALGRLKCRTAKEALMQAKERQDNSEEGIYARIMAAWALSQIKR